MSVWSVAVIVCVLGASGRVGGGAGPPNGGHANGDTCGLDPISVTPDSVIFADISSLEVDSEGRIFAADRRLGQIVVLSGEAGAHRAVGRKGKGPGEFMEIWDVQVLRGDSLLVYDKGLGRVTILTPRSYSVARTVRLPAPLPFWVYASRDGRLVEVTERYFGPESDRRKDPPSLRVVNLAGGDGRIIKDSLLVFPEPTMYLVGHLPQGLVYGILNPAGRPGEVILGPDDRIYYGGGDSLTIAEYSLSGELIQAYQAPHDPIPYLKVDADSLLESLGQVFRPAVADIRAQLPDTWPAFTSFVVDDDGRPWVGVVNGRGQTTNEWVVFERSGSVLCSVRVPRDTRIEAVRSRRAYAVSTDSLGVPRVVVYRVSLPAGSR